MVALLGLLEAREIGVEVLLGEPRGPVDALKHRLVVVAAPVRAGDLHELERADSPGARYVGAAAQVGEAALAVGGDRLALGQIRDELPLERLLFERVERLEAVELGAREALLLGDDLVHALLDRREVLGRERAADLEVVVEAVLDRRADAELGHREEVLDRLGHDVCRRVAQDVERLGALVGDDLDGVAVRDDLERVDHLAVDLAGDGGLREARPDRSGDVGDARALGHLLLAAVGQLHHDLGHLRRAPIV